MTTKTLDAAQTLDTMIELRNENAAAAAYWRTTRGDDDRSYRTCGDDDRSYRTCGLTESAMSDMIAILFKQDEDFTIEYVEETKIGVQISYNKFRRI